MSGLVTLGEELGQIHATPHGPLRPGSTATVSVCGAEATVAIGVRRLGVPAAYVGRVGDDLFGRMAVDVLRAEGVDVDHLVVDPGAPTGLLLRTQRTADRAVVEYRRTGSAGSRLCPEDIPEQLVRDADLLHLTGITPALSDSAARASGHAVTLARRAGVPISLDVNYRATLWSAAEAAAALRPLAAVADVVVGGRAELRLLAGTDAAGDELLGAVAALGAREVVCTEGAEGARALRDGVVHRVAAHPVHAVDVLGAGDAFVAGYLVARLSDRPVPERLELGATLGAFAVSTRGDWEGLPRPAELGLVAHADDVLR